MAHSGASSPASEYHQGAIFRLTKAGDPSIIVQFDGTDGAHTLGAGKVAKMITGPGDAFYGVLSDRVFRMPMVGAFSILHKFDTDADPQSGLPSSGIVFDRAGEIVGTTDSGAVYTIALVNAPFYNGSYTAVQNALPEAVAARNWPSTPLDWSTGRSRLVITTPFLSTIPTSRRWSTTRFSFCRARLLAPIRVRRRRALRLAQTASSTASQPTARTGGLGAVFAFAPFDDAPAAPNLVKFGNSHGFPSRRKEWEW